MYLLIFLICLYLSLVYLSVVTCLLLPVCGLPVCCYLCIVNLCVVYLCAELEHWMVGLVFPGLSLGQEAALTHVDFHTLHAAIPEHTHRK